jgi:hypothetical protein
LIRFNIAGNIPDNAIISDVQLTLYMSRTSSASTTIHLSRVLRDWGEGTSHASGEEGAGAPAQPNDATWIHAKYDSDLWDSPGGDYASSSSASRVVVGLGPYTWGSTADMVADVQGWNDDPSSNHGWIITDSELLVGSAKRFDSRENPIAANRPVLRVEYAIQVPTVSTWSLVMLSALLITAGSVLTIRTNRRINPRRTP